MPVTEDLGKAYANYYTHASRDATGQAGLLKRLYRLVKLGYCAGKYRYQIGSGSLRTRAFGKFMYLFPLRRNDADSEARYLHFVPQGRLLDVGCGSGEWLASMGSLGWKVDGVDFDENAVRVARQKGLAVRCGALEQQAFPDESFDAVVLNHVIEHVPNPIGTVAECARILKPGGKLILFTPNSSSLSHKLFKQDWRGLEPPRHLHVFSAPNLRSLLARAGLRSVSFRPQIARSVIYESVLLRRGQSNSSHTTRRDRRAGVAAWLFNVAELCLLKLYPSLVDCVAAIAVKV
jgi:2-polyprenyl-3-methyl-5-hydroxy-6-metoxy-1,4-benzoquinol methylase